MRPNIEQIKHDWQDEQFRLISIRNTPIKGDRVRLGVEIKLGTAPSWNARCPKPTLEADFAAWDEEFTKALIVAKKVREAPCTIRSLLDYVEELEAKLEGSHAD